MKYFEFDKKEQNVTGKDASGRFFTLDRRNFVVGGTALFAGFSLSGALPQAMAASKGEVTDVNAWISIHSNGDIIIVSPNAEMGQGTMTAIPLLAAEELDADWTRVSVEQVGPISKEFGNPIFGGIIHTVASLTTAGLFDNVRLAGAQARKMLLTRVAKHWKVPVNELTTSKSTVYHGSRSISYGDVIKISGNGKGAPKVGLTDLKKPSEYTLIGTDVPRVDIPQKVNGAAEFGLDVRVPGMIHASILRAPMHGAKPKKVTNSNEGALKSKTLVIKLDYGVAVVSEDLADVLTARDAIDVEWDLPALASKYDSNKALKNYVKVSEDEGAKSIGWPGKAHVPWAKAVTGDQKDFESKMRSEDFKSLSATYTSEHTYHAQMEPMNATAKVSADGKSAEIWAPTQAVSVSTFAAAGVLKTSPQNITLNTTFLGGGFGRRAQVDYVVDAVILSKITQKPVKVVWSREDDLAAGAFKPSSAINLAAAVAANGEISAWKHRTVAESPLRYYAKGLLGKNGEDILVMSGAEQLNYTLPNQIAEHVNQHQGTRLAAWRGIGHGPNRFASESFVDEIAHSIGKDPADYRLALANNPRAKNVIKKVMEMAKWGSQTEGTAQGIAYSDYNGSHSAGVAEISLDEKSGKITVGKYFIAVDPGLPLIPDNVKAQIEGAVIYGISSALTERVSHSEGVVEQSNYHDYEVLRMVDVPEVFIEILPSGTRPSAVGELGLPTTAPAIANAFYQMTGKRVRHMPMNSDTILEALQS
jgi:isoquinoline 1-oxidoreductase beta subunit